MNQLEGGSPAEDDSAENFAEFEGHLTRALRRVDAPEGFADGTMARLRKQEKTAAAPLLMMKARRQAWLGGAIAAALLAGVFSAEQMQMRQQRQRATMAQQQFEAGIRITDEALDHARDQLERAGVGGHR